MSITNFVGPNGETLTISKNGDGVKVMCHTSCDDVSLFDSVCSAEGDLPVEELTITLSGELVTYYTWNYNSQELIKYVRSGACKRCGTCCQKRIAFRADGKSAPLNDTGNGGQHTSDEGLWYERDGCSPRRFFGEFEVTEGKPCSCLTLKEGRPYCSQYFTRRNLCRDWPLGPESLEQFPDCGYSFEEVWRKPMSELESETN